MSQPIASAARAARTTGVATPEILGIGFADLLAAIEAGLRDFRSAPVYGLFFGGIYALGGWLIIISLWHYHLPYLAYPTAMGFALIAPFIVTGLYDVSRRREAGQPLSWSGVLGAVWDARHRDLRWMALVTAFALVIWLDIAALLFFGLLGFRSLDANLLNDLFTTPTGLLFLGLGHAAGALIALSIFSISVISFPLLFDRDVDFVTAMVTSVKSVTANPRPMVVWCVLIAILVFISILSGFLALPIVLPVLGHASWHLYRRTVSQVHPTS